LQLEEIMEFPGPIAKQKEVMKTASNV
jgi:hypothetical protein